MSKRKGVLDDVDPFTKTEEKKFKIDKRKEKVFFNGRWIDPEEDEETLLQLVEDKRDELRNLKNSFMRNFQTNAVEDENTRDKARKIGVLSTEIRELEDILNS